MLAYILIPLALIIILIAYLKDPKTRGKRGERKVKRIIGSTVAGEKYIINDLILENEGKTSQIDHVVINPRGVFVIETKNYSGTIYGAEDQREWTQVLAYGKVKNKLYNPLKQNATHIYNVKKVIGNLPIHSLVVFVQNNAYVKSDNVITLMGLKNALAYGERVLSVSQMERAYEALLSSKTEITTQEHVQNIREQQRDLAKGICPRCGGKLVLRKGKYGEFYGCENYPKCKFIKKL